jgi:hypothetical protein
MSLPISASPTPRRNTPKSVSPSPSTHILAERRLSQSRAARHLRINQPKISALSRYRLDGFSVERLMHLLARLGCDIEIVIRLRAKPRSKKSPASSSPPPGCRKKAQ